MARFNCVDGVRVQMTASEEAARDAEEAAWAADTERREAEATLKETEQDAYRLARMMEDLIAGDPPHAETTKWLNKRTAARAAMVK